MEIELFIQSLTGQFSSLGIALILLVAFWSLLKLEARQDKKKQEEMLYDMVQIPKEKRAKKKKPGKFQITRF